MERPILFRGEMVRAILEGRKTMTRRVVNKDISNQFDIDVDNTVAAYINQLTGDSCNPVEICPYGNIGDKLWVRETWGVGSRPDPNEGWVDGLEYKADELFLEDPRGSIQLWEAHTPEGIELAEYESEAWRPSIFMPRWASRITLEITGIRVERLQEITECDAEKEGMPDEVPMSPVYCPVCEGRGFRDAYHPLSLGDMEVDCTECDTAKKKFKNLWDSINGRKPGKAWNDNPWVWVVEFRRGDNV